MKTIMNIKKVSLVVLMIIVTIAVSAHPRHSRRVSHIGYRRPAVVRVVTTPAVTKHVSNRFSKNDRLDMVLAYLNNHKALSISKYRKMTGLTKATAEAELDAFAVSKNNPIKMIVSGKQKLYVI